MPDNDLQRQWASELAHLARSGVFTRRDVLRKASAYGLSIPLIGTVLASFGTQTAASDANPGASTVDGRSTSSPTRSSSPMSSGAPGGILSIGALTPSTAVDPVVGFDAASIAIFQLTNEYLIGLNRDFTLRAQLATEWEPGDNGQRWMVTLREGVTFTDGTPFDAEAVTSSFARLLDPESPSSSAQSAFAGILEADGVSVDDTGNIVFELVRPYADFPYLISSNTYNAVILPTEYAGSYIDNPVGTGPFLLDSYSAAEGATLSRNESYWEAGKPLLDGVEFKFYQDPQAQVIALQSGEIDTQVTSQIGLLASLEGNGDYTIDEVESTGLNVLTMRVDTPPFDRKEVRQAVAFALDRVAINETLYNGVDTIGNDHLLAPAYPASPTDLPQRELDLARVEELLAGEEVRFTLTFDPPTRDYAVVLQEQLRQAGIEVELAQVTSDEFYAGDQESDTPWLFTQSNIVGWAGRAVPTQFINPMVKSGGIWNGSKYSNPVVDTAAETYDTSTDDEEKQAQARIIAEAMHDDTPIIITTWSTVIRPFNSARWTGITAHPSSYIELNDVTQA